MRERRQHWDEQNRNAYPEVWQVVVEEYGFESTICSVEGCCRDNYAFTLVREEGSDVLEELRNGESFLGNENRLEDLKGELGKCIFHTDKENELWIGNWGREHEERKRKRDELRDRLNKLVDIKKLEGIISLASELRQHLQNKPTYKWIEERLGEFWSLIREYREAPVNENRWGIKRRGTYDFSRFVFPDFQYQRARYNTDKKTYIALNDTNFWKKNEDMVFSGDADFCESTFSERVVFEENTFEGEFILSEVKLLPPQHLFRGNLSIENSKGAISLSESYENEGGRIEIVNAKFKKGGGFILKDINYELNRSNFYIQNVDFTEAEKIVFEKVYLEEVKFTNVRWGDVDTERISPDLYKKRPWEARDIYRQLKLALDKQENYIDARKFYALELQAHGRELEKVLISKWADNLWGRLSLRFVMLLIMGLFVYALEFLLNRNPYYGLVYLVGIPILLYISSKIWKEVGKRIDALRYIVVYYFYGLTAGFGLTWVRPLVWLVGLVALYGWIEKKAVEMLSHFKTYAYLNSFVETFTGIYNLPFLNSHTDRSALGVKFALFILISYLTYQFIVALRRHVRR